MPGIPPPVNPPAGEGVCAPVQIPQAVAAGPVARRPARRRRGFASFLATSATLHAVIVLAGIVGGAAYQRRGGAEPAQAVILVEWESQEAQAASAPAEAEPERPLDEPPQATLEEPMPAESAADAPLPEVPASELLAGEARANPAAAERLLDDVLGDPRASWRLASAEAIGLQVGLAPAPHVSDCCGEPQPKPAATADVYVYPEVVSMARAEFPKQSQRLGEHGSVLLEMRVGTDGRVHDVQVIESSGYPRIDDCAVDAAWDWVFKPATRKGVPEEALAHHRYTFRLTGSG
jgi:protein TonB